MGQPFLEYLNQRKEHGREIGMETARKMISMCGTDAQIYFKYFIRDQEASVLEKANSSITDGKAKVDTVFDNTSVGSIDSQKDFEKVYEVAKGKGVTQNVVQNKHLKSDVEARLEDTNSRIETRRIENEQEISKQKSQADTKYNNNLFRSAGSNLGNSKRNKKKA